MSSYSFNLFKWKSYFSRLYKLLLECQTNDDCSNASDTCHENICKCGSNAKCTGRTDNCTLGNCTCGQNNECSEKQYCVSEHSSFLPHLQAPASHVSVLPVHFAFDPHLQIFSWQVSEVVEQSSLVWHSKNDLYSLDKNEFYLYKLKEYNIYLEL